MFHYQAILITVTLKFLTSGKGRLFLKNITLSQNFCGSFYMLIFLYENVYLVKEKYCTFGLMAKFFSVSQALAITNLLFVSLDLLILDTLYK